MTPLLEEPLPFPARRSMMAAAADGRIYCLGGVGALTASGSILDVADDLWSFDPGRLAWSRLEPRGEAPEPRRCAGWTAASDALLLWGGSGVVGTGAARTHGFLNDFWRLRLADLVWERVEDGEDAETAAAADAPDRPRPGPRYTAVFEPWRGSVLLFSGYTEDVAGKRMLADAWLREAHAWRRLTAGEPAGYDGDAVWPGARYGCTSTSDGDAVYVFGGASRRADHADLWRLCGNPGRFELLSPEAAEGPRPAPRYCAAMAVHRGCVFLFGGRSRWNPKLDYNDLWTFRIAERQWECIHGNRAPHRYDATASWPAYHAKAAAARLGPHLYVLGGEGLQGHVSDFWRLDLDACRWELIQPARRDDPVLW